MGKTKEQILNENKTEEELHQVKSKVKLDKIECLQGLLTSIKPIEKVFEEQQWKPVWDEVEEIAIKNKIIELINEL